MIYIVPEESCFQWLLNFKQEALWFNNSLVVFSGLSLLLLGKRKTTAKNHLICTSISHCHPLCECRTKRKVSRSAIKGTMTFIHFYFFFCGWGMMTINSLSWPISRQWDLKGVLWLRLISSPATPILFSEVTLEAISINACSLVFFLFKWMRC